MKQVSRAPGIVSVIRAESEQGLYLYPQPSARMETSSGSLVAPIPTSICELITTINLIGIPPHKQCIILLGNSINVSGAIHFY